MTRDSEISAKSKSHRYPYAPIKKKQIIGIVKRNPCKKIDSTGNINNKIRNKFVEKEKMSHTFTKNRRVKAKGDFQRRLEFNSQKRKMKKRELEKKYYNYDFNPKINQKRININPKNLPSHVYKTKKVLKGKGNISKPPKRKSRLGTNTHIKKIKKLKDEMSSHLSNMQSNGNRSENTQVFAEGIEPKIESIKYNYSVTNNNSLKSIHQKLKSPKHPDQEEEPSSFFENQSPQNAIRSDPKFHGFSKSHSKFTKKSLTPDAPLPQLENINHQDRINSHDFIDQNAGKGSSTNLHDTDIKTHNSPILDDPQRSQNLDSVRSDRPGDTILKKEKILLGINKVGSKRISNLIRSKEINKQNEVNLEKLENSNENLEEMTDVWEVSQTETNEKSELQNDMELRIKGHFSKHS